MKLPEIQYTKVSLPQGTSPFTEAVKAKGAQDITSALFDTAAGIAKVNADYKISQATLRTQNEINVFEENFRNKPAYTAEEARELKLEGIVNLQENGEDRAMIPAHEVYPFLKNRAMETIISRNAEAIGNPQQRENWLMEMSQKRSAIVAQDIDHAQQQAIKWTLAERQLDIVDAQAAGNYVGAAEVIRKAYASDPTEMRNQLNINETARVEHSFRNKMTTLSESGDVAGLQAIASRLRDDASGAEYATLNDKELNAWADSFDRMAKATEAEAKARLTEGTEQARASWWQGFNEKARSPQGLRAADLADLDALGYMTPGDIKAAWKMFDNQVEGRSVHPKSSNPQVYWEMANLMADPDANPAVIAKELNLATGDLSESDWQSMANKAVERRKSPTYNNDVLSDAAILKRSYAQLELDPKSDDLEELAKLGRFQRAFTAEVERAQSENNGKITSGEKQDIADRLTLEVKNDAGNWFGIGDFKGNVFEFIYDDMDASEAEYDARVNEIIDALGRRGKAVTAENIMQIYKATK